MSLQLNPPRNRKPEGKKPQPSYKAIKMAKKKRNSQVKTGVQYAPMYPIWDWT